MPALTSVAPCTIRDAERDEADFCDLVVRQSGLPVPLRRQDATVRVAVRRGQVVGFASVTVGRDAPRLDYVFVHHHARGCGVGRALVGDACHVDPDRRAVHVAAHPSAETFFRRVGACREGTLAPDDQNPFSRAVFSVG